MALSFGRPHRRFTSNDLLRTGLAKGLVFVTFPGDGGVNLVSGAVPSFIGFSAVGSPYCPGSTIAQGSSNGLSYGTYFAIPSGSSTYTIIGLAKPPSVVRSTALFCQGTDAGSFQQIVLAMNEDEVPQPAGGKVALIEYNGGKAIAAATAGTPIDGNWHVFAATRNGGNVNAKLYVDGVVWTTNNSGSDTTISTANPVYACGNSASDKACDYPVAFVAVWNRALSAAEHVAFALNPWQLFRPQPIWVPKFAPAAGAGFIRPAGRVYGQAVNRASRF